MGKIDSRHKKSRIFIYGTFSNSFLGARYGLYKNKPVHFFPPIAVAVAGRYVPPPAYGYRLPLTGTASRYGTTSR